MAKAALTDLIYEAAINAEAWHAVLGRIRDFSDSWGAAFHAVDPARGIKVLATDEYGPLVGAWAARPDRPENVRPARFLASRYQGFLSDLDLCTEAELAVDPIYEQYFRPAGIGWTGGTVFALPTSELLVVDLVRSIERGPFDKKILRRLDVIRPHLARALYLSVRLGLEKVRAAAEALAVVGLPAAVLTRNGRALAINGLLDCHSSRINFGAGDRIAITSAAAHSLTMQALQNIADDRTPTTRSIPLPATEEDPALVLHVVPLRRSAHDLFPSADAFLVVMPVTAPAAPLTELLNGLFDLTPSEARVAQALTAGASVNDMAADFVLSRETVRGRLKDVFQKTGVHSQAELVGLLSGLTLTGTRT